LFEVSHGDVRRLENIMQACAALGTDLTEAKVFDMASVARPTEIKEVLEMCAKGEFVKAKDKMLNTMLTYGLAGLDAVKQIQGAIWTLNIPDRAKLEMIKDCGDAEFRMVEGSDEFIQLEALLAKFVLEANKN
jgi:replication factor C small subunit